MSVQDLPEKRWADLLDSVGAFAPANEFKRQIGFFDEERLDKNERCISILVASENTADFDNFEDINIRMVFVSKQNKSDAVETSILARQIQSLLENTVSFQDIFGIINQGLSGNIILESGRQAFELNFRMMSNYCVNT